MRFCRVRTELVEHDLPAALATVRKALSEAPLTPPPPLPQGERGSRQVVVREAVFHLLAPPSPLVGEGGGG
jgi:hypothetical protein